MEVQFNQIKVGEIYGVTRNNIYNNNLNEKFITLCKHMGERKIFGIFKSKIKYYWDNRLCSFDNESTFYSNLGYRFFLLGQKEKIQNAMEERALKKIIEKIIGHPI
jgi:hypothetical protein